LREQTNRGKIYFVKEMIPLSDAERRFGTKKGKHIMKIQNPVLPGFNSDPSIIRVADTYYIATSTFEWFPGVRIHASQDLVHWNLVKNVLSFVFLEKKTKLLSLLRSCNQTEEAQSLI